MLQETGVPGENNLLSLPLATVSHDVRTQTTDPGQWWDTASVMHWTNGPGRQSCILSYLSICAGLISVLSNIDPTDPSLSYLQSLTLNHYLSLTLLNPCYNARSRSFGQGRLPGQINPDPEEYQQRKLNFFKPIHSLNAHSLTIMQTVRNQRKILCCI